MRQLWRLGWMHNRVRMIAASLLVKHLLQPWQDGAAWFWDTLVDADLANNSASWQWIAGCGTDASPWFRVFNPVLQGEKFDPTGRYVKRFLPELTGLPDRFIHRQTTANQIRFTTVALSELETRILSARDRALEIDPDCSLAQLVAEVLSGAVPPEVWQPPTDADLPVLGPDRAS